MAAKDQRPAATNDEWPEGGLPHGEHPYDYGYGGGEDDLTVLGRCPHGVDLDREFCPEGCRV